MCYELRERGRIALENVHYSRNREYIALQKDLTYRAQDLNDTATELSYLADLHRTKLLVSKDQHGDNCDVMEGETLAIIKDLNILAEEQEQTVQDINKQLRDLKKADRHNYKELLNLINPNQDITFATPSGISEEHRLAIVNRLETAAMRQQLKTMVQESLTEFIV